MKVIVVYEFDGLDLDSEDADMVIDNIARMTHHTGRDLQATACWIDEAMYDEDDERALTYTRH